MASWRKRQPRPASAPLPRAPPRPTVSFLGASTALMGEGAHAYYSAPDAVARFLAARPHRPPYAHQESGAAFMAQRMRGADGSGVLGGFLCDEMRVGKTGTCALFMLADVQQRVSQNPRARFGAPFLVVCPKDVAPVWPPELASALGAGTLLVRVLTTDSAALVPHAAAAAALHAQLVGETDVIVTTYSTLSHRDDAGNANADADAASGAAAIRRLLRALTYRAVLCDEAHVMRAEGTRVHQTVAALAAAAKWYVTGTPVHNSLDDLRGALRLIGVPGARVDAAATPAQVAALAAPLTLRRRLDARTGRVTERDAAPLPLPVVTIDFATPLERALYDHAVAEIMRRVAAASAAAAEAAAAAPDEERARHTPAHEMQAIHNMRAICLSPYAVADRLRSGVIPLLPGALLVDADEAARAPRSDAAVARAFLLAEAVGGDTDAIVRAHEAHVGAAAWPATSARITQLLPHIVPPVSSKERWLLNALVGGVLEPRGEKAVIVSNWRQTLERLQWLLAVRAEALAGDGQWRAPCQVVHGSMSAKARVRARQRFAAEPACSVLLCTLTAGNVGVDLTCANHMVFTDPWWNPYPEIQAEHRLRGPLQTRDVHIYSLAMRDSIDEDVIYVRNEKLVLDAFVSSSAAAGAVMTEDADADADADATLGADAALAGESALGARVFGHLRANASAEDNDSDRDDEYAYHDDPMDI